jgi:hypothetical protein
MQISTRVGVVQAMISSNFLVPAQQRDAEIVVECRSARNHQRLPVTIIFRCLGRGKSLNDLGNYPPHTPLSCSHIFRPMFGNEEKDESFQRSLGDQYLSFL